MAHTFPPPADGAFSQANKLCCRATSEQSAWLAEHMATSGRSISRVLRDALDLYITAHSAAAADHAVVGELPAAIVSDASGPATPAGLRLASLR